MRKIEERMLAALRAGRNWKEDNTEVRFGPLVDEDGLEHRRPQVFLHGNLIASFGLEGWRFRLAGWNTPTTRSRINALCTQRADVRGVYTKNGQAYAKRYAAQVQDPQGADQAIDDSEWF